MRFEFIVNFGAKSKKTILLQVRIRRVTPETMLYRINFIFKLSLAGTGQISVSGTRECFDFLESLLSVAIFLSAERQGQSKRKWKSKKSAAKIRPDGRLNLGLVDRRIKLNLLNFNVTQ